VKFAAFARRTSEVLGTSTAFAVAVSVVLLWAISGPFAGFSETWQLVINTGTTISTFLMVFLLQHTQNRDTQAIQKKLDELIQGLPGPRDEVAGIEKDESNE
jgi:low affinity Fe/Cu permease